MTRLPHALAAIALCAAALTAHAQSPQPPEVAAKAYLVMDVSSGQILAGKDMDSPVEPASLTKLMTAYVVFDALRAKKITLTQTLPVSERAWKTPGSRMYIDPKMQVPVEDLIKGMIVQSGNDATVALAEGVAGTVERFVELMNDQAKALGLKNTHYTNVDGLPDPAHVTTARELALLSARLMQEFPEDAKYYAIKKYRYPGTPASNDTNRNTLLFRDPTVDGLKTGHTKAAGYCLVATAARDFPNLKGRRVVSVLLGATSDSARINESQKLLNWGYTAWDDVKLFDAGQPVATPRVWKGKASELKLGSATPIVVSVPAGTAAQVKTEIARPDPLIAPFKKGQTVATLKIKQGDQTLGEVPLVALDGVEESGFFGRAWDAMRLWIQ
ncbi:MAG TPA: D-alanyl-D-alanine carboxypeptidase family protein [Ottowia sp.]|nr:D-alanyl-D-alanine carboxypeptidase family protein [Ottowia sp.]